ncbi:MAG TPA: hypothetical protein VGE52_18680 [Pirellulales bacterium]
MLDRLPFASRLRRIRPSRAGCGRRGAIQRSSLAPHAERGPFSPLIGWGMLLLYVFAASGLPIPVLVVEASEGANRAATACGKTVCGCSPTDRALGNCCCAKGKTRAAIPAKASCCAATLGSKSSESPGDATSVKPASDEASGDQPASRRDGASRDSLTLDFLIGIEAAKCRGDDVSAGVFLLPHLPTPAVSTLLIVDAVEAKTTLPLYVGRVADPPAPPPRLIVAL